MSLNDYLVLFMAGTCFQTSKANQNRISAVQQARSPVGIIRQYQCHAHAADGAQTDLCFALWDGCEVTALFCNAKASVRSCIIQAKSCTLIDNDIAKRLVLNLFMYFSLSFVVFFSIVSLHAPEFNVTTCSCFYMQDSIALIFDFIFWIRKC